MGKSYQNNKNVTTFNVDQESESMEDVTTREVSNASNGPHQTQNSRDIPPLSDLVSDNDDTQNKAKKKRSPKKKKNDREHNQTPHLLNQTLNKHKYRGKGGQNTKYDYVASGGMFQKRKAVPTATQFGTNNVWELNFSPMSRMAHYESKQRQSPKKKKKVKYKSGHVRRETRLKKAFEAMKAVENDDNDKTQQTQNKPKANKSKSKGKQIYSKYRKNQKPKTNTQMEF